MTHVIIVGAGYAGVTAANRLARSHQPDLSVTLVNPRPDFVERIRLHERAAAGRTVTRPLRTLLHPEVGLHVASASRIGHGGVATDRGDLDADLLVHAVGSTAARIPPGTFAVDGLGVATGLADRLRHARAGTPVTVVGGGLTGIETAAEISAEHPGLRVRLVTEHLGPGMPDRARGYVRRTLEALGADVVEGERVTAPEDGITVWATTPAVSDLARSSGLSTDSAGRMLVDAALRSIDAPAVIGAGDAAATGARMSCQAAIPLGLGAAETALALMRGQEPAPVRAGFALWCVSLGRRRGLVQPVSRDDTPRGRAVTGRVGAGIKERISRATLTFVRRPSPAWHRSGTSVPAHQAQAASLRSA